MAEVRLPRWVPKPIAPIYLRLRPHLPDRSFITIHYAYFIGTSLVGSLLIWGSSTTIHVSYTDALFLAVSAMTLAGLNTVNLSEMNTFQQFILFLLIILGSAILVSAVVVHVRKRAFEKKLKNIADERAHRRARRHTRVLSFSHSLSRGRSSSHATRTGEVDGIVLRGSAIPDDEAIEDVPQTSSNDRPVSAHHIPSSRFDSDVERGHGTSTATDGKPSDLMDDDHVRFDESAPPLRRPERQHTRLFTGTGVGAADFARHPRTASWSKDRPVTIPSLQQSASSNGLDKYLKTVNGLLGRNSQISNLTHSEREALGGLEYQAVSLLSVIVPVYFIAWQLLGAVGCGAWINNNRSSTARSNGLNPYWVGAFFAISAFNNSGMALLDANMTAFQTSYYLLLTMGLLILAGNTCYPPFLRLILWIMKKCTPNTPRWQEKRKVIEFTLDHPRRVYTHLFPAQENWFLVGTLVILNGIDWFAFGVLDIGNKSIANIPVKFRVLDGLFQAFAIRSGGFYVFTIVDLAPGLLVLYVLMMYISVYPVTMTIRNTNLYEERSLGVYAEDLPNDENEDEATSKQKGAFLSLFSSRAAPKMSKGYFLHRQLHGQLAHDSWWLAIAVLFITIIETSQVNKEPRVFSVFNILFEVVSAYGCVGVSTGVPWNAYSFSGAWHKLSKLILCAVMLRGRHRGLPVAIDKAVLLPDRTLAWAEEEDAALRADRGLSRQRTGLKNA